MARRPPPEFTDRFLNEVETAELLDVSVPALREDRQSGRLGIGYHKFGTRVRYLLSEILAWAAARRVSPPAPRSIDAEDDELPSVLTDRPRRRARHREYVLGSGGRS